MGSNFAKADQPTTNQTRTDHDRQQDSIMVLGSVFNMVKSPDHNQPHRCRACRKKIKNSPMYIHKSNEWKLHTTCGHELKHEFSVPERSTFILLKETDVRCRMRCYKCKKDGNLSGVSCVSSDGRHRFHLPCYMELLDKWKKSKGSNIDFLEGILEAANALSGSCVNTLGGCTIL